jgi:hypothetical protein
VTGKTSSLLQVARPVLDSVLPRLSRPRSRLEPAERQASALRPRSRDLARRQCPERLENAATSPECCATGSNHCGGTTMRLSLGLAACLTLASGQALPSPLLSPSAPQAEAVIVHHKPGHHGGPPWARRDDDWRDRDRYERYNRYDRRRVTECRTRYDETYDPYRGAYVRRPVEICSSW